MPPSPPRKDKARELREAVIEDADRTGVEDRDLVHGEDGTLGSAAAKTSTRTIKSRRDARSIDRKTGSDAMGTSALQACSLGD